MKTPADFIPLTTGTWHYTQLISRTIVLTQKDGSVHAEKFNTGSRQALDAVYVYNAELQGAASITPGAFSDPADGSSDLLLSDSPYLAWEFSDDVVKAQYVFSATSYVMYNPGTPGAIDVAIKGRNWGFGVLSRSAEN
jgi:hypothetical protein